MNVYPSAKIAALAQQLWERGCQECADDARDTISSRVAWARLGKYKMVSWLLESHSGHVAMSMHSGMTGVCGEACYSNLRAQQAAPKCSEVGIVAVRKHYMVKQQLTRTTMCSSIKSDLSLAASTGSAINYGIGAADHSDSVLAGPIMD